MSLRRRGYMVEAGSCPVRTMMYGGMPEAGGYGSAKEFEIGAQKIAEAAHCILGSLGKIASKRVGKEVSPETMAAYLPYEQAHLREEMGIIRKSIKEYAKPVYLNQINYPTKDVNPEYHEQTKGYVKKSIENIRKVSPGLYKQARSMTKQFLANRKGLPVNVVSAALLSYVVIGRLARAMEESVKPWPGLITKNPFKDSRLRGPAAELEKYIGLLLKDELGKF